VAGAPRLVVMTGGSAGIGRATALGLAGPGTHLVLLGRSEERAAEVLEEAWHAGATADFAPVDLASLESVAEAAPTVAAFGAIDLLIADAGVAGVRGATADGFEIAFGVNHLGHHLLVRLLMPQVRKATAPRVVVVSSDAHRGASAIDWDALRRPTRSITGITEYQVSKLCNVLHVRELARREPEVDVYAVHPGMVATDIWRRVPQPARWLMTRRMLEPEVGAETVLHCATDPAAAGRSGTYWARMEVQEPSEQAGDDALAKELWERSEGWTSGFAG
jgi:retinol dehydrogenase 12